MKKLGFIAIAMVTLLATLGIGFSMWSQTVTVNGTVNTGKLAFSISAPTGTWVYKDESAGAQVLTYTVTGPANGALPSFGAGTTINPNVASLPAGAVLIGSAYTSISTNNVVTMTWSNIFPIGPFVQGAATGLWCADFDLLNTSTIPVKFHAVVSSKVDMGILTGPTITYSGLSNAGAPTEFNLEGYQLEPGTTPLHVHVCIGVPDDNADMGITTGSFTLTIQAVQWNEFGGTVIQTTGIN